MLTTSTEQLYVAELWIPTYFYQESDIRGPLRNTETFGIAKGYWRLRPLPENAIIDGQAAFVLTISYASSTLKDAEEHALWTSRTFSSLASSFAAHPVASPELRRIATVDRGGRLVSQTNYWYGQKLFMLSAFSQVTQYQFQQYIQQVSSMADMDRYRLQSAIHWYVSSLSTIEPTASIVAAWTGLECLGKVLNDKYHSSGTKAPCRVCGNSPGIKRNRKIAGIEHIFCLLRQLHCQQGNGSGIEEIISSDFVDDFDVGDAKTLRNTIVHGLEHVTFLEERCKEVRRHLSHVLNASIQHAMAVLVPSGIAGDFDVHPEGRSSVKFETALRQRPYFGEWVEGFRVSYDSVDSPRYPGVARIEWVSDVNLRFVESKCQEVFHRGSEIYEESDESLLTGIPAWDERPSEPPWERMQLAD